MFTELTTALGALKGASAVISTINNLDDHVKRNEAIYKIQGLILDAQSAAIGAQERVSVLIESERQLKIKISEFGKFETEKERYFLNKLPGGGIVYTIKEEANDCGPTHHLCATCFEQSKKVIM